jgi:cytoskeletal protein RodZ
MWVVLVAVVAVVAVAVVGALVRRPRGTDLSSVRKYHSALGTIEHLSEGIGPAPRVVGASDRTVDGDPGAGPDRGRGSGDAAGFGGDAGSRTGAGPTGGVRTVPGTNSWDPSVPVSGNGGRSGAEGPLVFDDSRSHEPQRRESSTPGAINSRADRAQKHALESMNRRPRRGTTAMVVVAAVVVFATLAYLGSRRSEPTHHQTGSAGSSESGTSTSAVRSTDSTSTTRARSGVSGQGVHASKRGGKPKATPTTPTTQIVAASTTPGGATYPVSANSYSVTVTASGPCWVLARTLPSGSTLWTGTLEAGAVKSVQATGAIAVELGASSGSLTVDNVPVALPTPLHTPFEATFEPVTAGASPGSTATPTPGTGAAPG